SRKMPTVFVREGAKTADNRQIYVLLVPGLRMEFSQHPSSDFVIHGLRLDGSYAKLQKDLKKPGIFKVTKDAYGYQGELIERVTSKEGRVITVAESSGNMRKTMADAARSAKEPIGDSVIDRFG